ncbi:MAG: sensor domain-containing diguanylate cyclase [Oscillospiraceae bacterium]|nr:sensor domain-containing diguanylate cyclase [Oscillospiraceae bacterium]
MANNRSQVERLTIEQLLTEKIVRINDDISNRLQKAQTLAVYVQRSGGDVYDFEQLAYMLIDGDPVIMNLLLAPSGIVTYVFPPEGNEAVIGLDFFSEGAGNYEAVLARETGQLVLGGPFDSVQGVPLIVGRLPIFFDDDNNQNFWGIASVSLNFPFVMESAGLNELTALGFDYEIWRIRPDDQQVQIIAQSTPTHGHNRNYVEMTAHIQNTEWNFRISPYRPWYAFFETWVSLLLAAGLSFFSAVVRQSYQDLKVLKNKLEQLATIDPLTGVHNRRYFMENVAKNISRVERLGGQSYIMLLDLDHFKHVNDEYGHQSGDKVLVSVAELVGEILRPYDLFARYGGEEFILFISDISESGALHLAERIRAKIAQTPIEVPGTSITITASIGLAHAGVQSEIDRAVFAADTAMYKAKSGGRNRVVLHHEGDSAPT